MNYQKPKAKLDGKVTKVSKNEFLFEASKWKLLLDGRAKIIFFYTYIWKKADHTKGFVLCEEVSLKEMTASLCNNHFGGMKYGLGTPSHGFASSCFIEYFI